jgi:hypothetical protein
MLTSAALCCFLLRAVCCAAVRRSRSMLLVPCTSQELPAPQHMHVEVPLHAPLPVLSALANTCAPAQAPHAHLHAASFLSQPAAMALGFATHPSLPVAVAAAAQQPQGAAATAAAAAAATPAAVSDDSAAIAAGTTVFGSLGMSAADQAVGGHSAAQQSALASAAAGLAHHSALSGLLQLPDHDVQMGVDSPRAASRAGTRQAMTPLPPRSRAGTPGSGAATPLGSLGVKVE